ncbi:hypothetical protein Hypma_002939 [Hypsizygus marmoreus]|uniref:Uncharacterized protein n=1 Tax=Hypsizygus marmoreus TaxID=39966 RepID=A0A369JAT9_HYPMA|nr:hypothetical protein Hypma_002939 [Hypsizygus marmoreus]
MLKLLDEGEERTFQLNSTPNNAREPRVCLLHTAALAIQPQRLRPSLPTLHFYKSIIIISTTLISTSIETPIPGYRLIASGPIRRLK